MIEYPLSAKDMSRTHHFGRKVLPKIFFGCAVCAEGLCKEDIVAACTEEVGNWMRQKPTSDFLEDAAFLIVNRRCIIVF